jgi:hypothetical protein
VGRLMSGLQWDRGVGSLLKEGKEGGKDGKKGGVVSVEV